MPGYDDLVENAPLRQVFLKSDVTAGQLAARVGITRKFTTRRVGKDGNVKVYVHRGGDATATMRDLGLRPEAGKRRQGKMRGSIREAKALRYAKALGIDPLDVGL